MQTNFLVIGSGISGLNFALNAAKKGQVCLVTKKKIIDSNTNYAQGGIAAVLDKTDNFSQHVSDTLTAGCHHNNKKAVEFMVKNSPEAIYHLVDLGVKFAKEKGKLKLAQEGGHNKRRIAFVGDYTGKEIEETLVKRVREHPNIHILEDCFAKDLIVENKECLGAEVIHSKEVFTIWANQTILATGGIGQLYTTTTNAAIATADGLAMAIRAGCDVRDLEFIQFHPTAFAKKMFPRFLISEAVRGEGGKIVNHKEERIMIGVHPLEDLAPRDIVAREIYKHLKEGPVYLDIRHEKTSKLKSRFPQIFNKLKENGYNMSKDLIPLIPAAHYACGGIKTNLKGQTKVKNLFAFGEVACTGVHGANRLASNSLLEALVFSNQVLKKLKKETQIKKSSKSQKLPNRKDCKEEIKMAEKLKKDIQKLMWEYAGIIRNCKRIKNEGIPKAMEIKEECRKLKKITQEACEAKNMIQAALVVLQASQKRKKSLGCHFVE